MHVNTDISKSIQLLSSPPEYRDVHLRYRNFEHFLWYISISEINLFKDEWNQWIEKFFDFNKCRVAELPNSLKTIS